ncbi:MAG: DUF4435 domain-containing protein [Bacteroidaceae bacterium]|nr:DUF4435 domain-containing protein [Bacteroidaceae bacterium]
MKRLIDNVNSRYVEAANRLLPDRKRGRIIAFVESYDDVAFWRLLLDEFENDSWYFQIMLPDKGGLTKGKKSALRSCIEHRNLGKYMIACVDSDYDWLLQGATNASKEILSNPYVIQTYTYAIENYQCYSGSLHNICVQCTLNDRRIVDFEAFMEMYSIAVYPLFVWNIWFYRKRLHNLFSMQDLNVDIRLKTVDIKHPQNAIIATSDRVRRKINSLAASHPDAIAEVEAISKELSGLGVREKETYLYLQGHHLVENVILKLLTPVCTRLRQERESDIRRYAVHDQQYRNEISAYQHSQMGIVEALRKNTHYRECELYEKMREDMRRFLSMLPERGGEQQQDSKDLQPADNHKEG